jgi:hypothetical protein
MKKLALVIGLCSAFVFVWLIASDGVEARKNRFLPPPTLGTYENTTVFEGENSIVSPSAAPVGATRFTARTSRKFRGTLVVNPTTGVVRVTNARPAGTYTVNLTATAADSTTSTASFTLTVIAEKGCAPFATSNFTGTATFSTGAATDTPQFGAIADFNNDGNQDYVAGVFVGDKASVFLGDGNGGFGPVLNLPGPAAGSTQFPAVGDFNGDGNADIAATNVNNDSVSIWLGNGNGTFGTRLDRPSGDAPRNLVVGDFNNDGKQDLATVGSGTTNTNVVLHLGNGDGTFAALSNVPIGGLGFALVIGEFTNDNNDDLITATTTSFKLLTGNGSGGFTVTTVGTVASNTEWAEAADFNNDGSLDVSIDNISAANDFNIFLGANNGTFANAPGSPFTVAGAGTFGHGVGDFDGDGNQDVIVANLTSNNVDVFRGNGTGAVASLGTLTFTGPRGLNFGDLNNDGRQDVVFIERSAGRIAPRTGTCAVDITNSTLPNGTPNQPYPGATITATGGTGPYTYSATGLPTGMSISAAGVISGTPAVPGTFYPKFTATDSTPGTPNTTFRVIPLVISGAVPGPATLFDFEGDHKADVSIFRSSAGEWWWRRSSDLVVAAATFGASSDIVVAHDYTGDGKTDLAVFRPSTSSWFILRSEDGSFYSFPFGSTGDVPMPADFDGDGKADAAIYRPSNSLWVILHSSNGQAVFTTFGTTGDQPVAADYDGDGKADVGIFRPSGGSGGEWWIQRSTAGLLALSFGTSTDKAVPADYTGDGKADVAFYRPGTSNWFILRSEDFSFYSFPWGSSGDIPTPGDYDGDGKTDAAVFRPSAQTWFLLGSTSGAQFVGFGLPTDFPVPNAYVR